MSKAQSLDSGTFNDIETWDNFQLTEHDTPGNIYSVQELLIRTSINTAMIFSHPFACV